MNRSEEQLTQVLAAVLKSRTFSRSPRLRQTLQSIWSSQRQGGHVTQKELAMDLYGFNGTDLEEILCRTRRTVTELRKRLIEYEAREGQEEELVLRIPSGVYRLELCPSGNGSAMSGQSADSKRTRERLPCRGAAAHDKNVSGCPAFSSLLRFLAEFGDCPACCSRPGLASGRPREEAKAACSFEPSLRQAIRLLLSALP